MRSTLEPRRINIRDIAKMANVSVATVSRAMNGVTTVDPRMVKQVWDVIAKHEYFPNSQARALVSGRSQTLGLIVSEITNPFFPELIEGFEEIAVQQGYEIWMGSTNYDPKRMTRCVRRMLERNVDGVAVMTFGVEASVMKRLTGRSVALVMIDSGVRYPKAGILEIDYYQGISQGVRHLANLGHRNIGFITGPMRLHSAKMRKAAFERSLKECGIKRRARWILEGDHTLEGGANAAKCLIEAKEVPTALMCSNDMTAIGVLHQVDRSGLSVPRDLSVIGFDNIHLTEVMIPPLTTVEMSRFEIARAAVSALRDQIEDQRAEGPQRKYTILTKLIVRQSTAAPRKAAISAGKTSIRNKPVR
jgi:LacI family transcriptional regulator